MFNIKALLQNIAIFSHLLPLLLYLIFLRKNTAKEIRVVFFYCLYAFINDCLITKVLNRLEVKNNSVFVLLSLFTLVEYLLFSIALYVVLKKRLFKNFIRVSTVFFIAICIYQFYLDSHKSAIDSLSITLEYILLIIFCLFYFFQELNEPNATFIYSSHRFWIALGILIYSTGTFFFFMQSGHLSDEQFDKWAPINYVFTLIKNALFGIAILIKKNPPPNHSMDPSYDELFEKPLTRL